MNLSVIFQIAQKNSADIEAILKVVPISTLLSLLPHLAAIAQTVQQAQATKHE